MTASHWALAIFAAWAAAATAVGIALGKAVHRADVTERRHSPDADLAWLADQPVDVLSKAEIDRRLHWLEHPW